MYTKQELKNIIALCDQMSALAADVITEAENQHRWNPETRQHESYKQWPYLGGTRTTGTMRHHSMTLTRALADLRKP